MKAVDVEAQGLRLCLWDHAPAGPVTRTVLCIHGALDTGRSWDAVVAAVAARDPGVRVVAIDLRGHGHSEAVGKGGSYHLLDFLKDLGVVLHDHFHDHVDVVVGHSMGGNLALMLVGALPDCTDRLILVDSVGPPPEDAAEQPARVGELLISLASPKKSFAPVNDVAEAVGRLQKWNPGLSTAGARRMIEPVLVERDGALHFPFDARLRGPTPFRWSEDFWRGCCDRFGGRFGGRSGGRSGGTPTSTTILRAREGFVPPGSNGGGDSDDSVGPPFDDRARRLRANVIVVDGGHHIHVEHPDVIAAAILR